MKHPFRTGYRLAAIALSVIFSFSLLTGRDELLPIFVLAVVVGVPSWLIMGGLLGVALALMAAEERPKSRVYDMHRRVRLREELTPAPEPKKETGPFLRINGEITSWGWPEPRKGRQWTTDASKSRS